MGYFLARPMAVTDLIIHISFTYERQRLLSPWAKEGHSLSATNLPKQRTTASVSFVEISCHETDCELLAIKDARQ